MSSYSEGEFVRTRQGLLGKVVWQGDVPGKGFVYGVRLEDWSENGNDGSHNGKHYFRCSPGHGQFAYAKNLSSAPAPKPKKESNIKIGDVVTLRNGKEGTALFVGQVGKNEVVGLRLKFWSESGHDGKSYYKCPQGFGYFAKLKDVVEIKRGKGGQTVELQKNEAKKKESTPPSAESQALVQCAVGDTVRLARGRVGVVKWIGNVAKKRLIGLELDAWSEKGNDGTLKGVKYFQCREGRGYFSEPSKVAEVVKRAPAPKQSQKPATPEPEEEEEEMEGIKIAIGDKVELRKGRVGWVRYIGDVKGLRGEVIGLELVQWFDRGHNGCLSDGTKYYNCKDGTGYWTSRAAVKVVLEQSGLKQTGPKRKKKIEMDNSGMKKQEQKSAEPTVDFIEEDTVRLRKGREGVVKYYNRKSGIVGIELLQWSADGTDGTYKKKEYFKCDKGRGYFTTAAAVKEIMKKAPRPEMDNQDANGGWGVHSQSKPSVPSPIAVRSMSGVVTARSMPGTPQSMSGNIKPRNSVGKAQKNDSPKADSGLVSFEIGDRVRLQRGRTGTVRFYGKTNFSPEKVVGLELDAWSEKGNDGTAGGIRYFKTRGPGWGYFTKASAIKEVMSPMP